MADEASPCVESATRIPLPDLVPETSGLALGRRDPSVIWTHNDSGGEPVLHAVDDEGRLLGSVRVQGAANLDWEAMDVGDCPEGACLYLADIGDNAETRDAVVLYRVPEPAPTDPRTAAAGVLRLTYPDGPRDAEALFVLPGERLFVVSKGRSHPPALYRVPLPPWPGETVEMVKVQDLADDRPSLPDQVTGASADPEGRIVAVRTYASLRFHAVLGDSLTTLPLSSHNLRPLEEPQGEAVALGPEGLVVLTSEAGRVGRAGMARIRCRLDGS